MFFILICGMLSALVDTFLRATLHFTRIVLEIEKTSDAKSFSFLRVFCEIAIMVSERRLEMLR